MVEQISVKFGTTAIAPNSTISVKLAQKSLNISWTGGDRDLHTLIFYDIDAPYPENPKNSPYLHWLVVNIPSDKISKGDTLIDYIPPNPPQDSPPHKYIIEVLKQTKIIRPVEHKVRKNFRLDQFIDRNRLEDAHVFIFNANPGADDPPDPTLKKYHEKLTETSPVLQRYAHSKPKNPEIEAKKRQERDAMFLPDNPLTEPEKKYESCVIKVAAKQKPDCNKSNWKYPGGKSGCYDPWQVCGGGVGADLGKWLDFDNMTKDQLIGFARSHGVEVPTPYSKSAMLKNIKKYKSMEA